MMNFQNVYFISGNAYAGKSTMVKLLADKYGGILCEENYHDRFLFSGFPVILRDESRTVEQTLTLVEKSFGLV